MRTLPINSCRWYTTNCANSPARKLAHETPGQTLQPTALVHEAYLRLVGDQQFDGRGHFFAAAAEAMRRILVESARKKKAIKHGGDLQRVELDDQDVPIRPLPDEIVALMKHSRA